MDLEAAKTKYSDYTTNQLLELVVSLHGTIQSLRDAFNSRGRERRQEDPEGIPPLFDEVESIVSNSESEVSEETSAIDVKSHSRICGKRCPLPASLPRIRREFDLSEEQKICPKHGSRLVRIGENITEHLEYVPAKAQVIQDVTFTYKCPCCSESADGETMLNSTAPLPPIPKSFATPSLLAYIAVSKYSDALPLYRLENIFSRIGVDLSRATMARRIIKAAELARPLWNLLVEVILESKVVCCDETTIQVLNEPMRTPEQVSYMWAILRPYHTQLVAFHYHTGRSGKAAKDVLQDFDGILICDGLKSYNHVKLVNGATLAGCLAHIRRKFWSAEKAAKAEKAKDTYIRASRALNWIRKLYAIEAEIQGKPPDEVAAIRRVKSLPVMENFAAWLDSEVDCVLPKSLLGKAIEYARGQWPKMQVFLTNGLVPIGRVKMWRGGNVGHYSVSTSCSSNRTCAASASGFRPKESTFSLSSLQPWSLAV